MPSSVTVRPVVDIRIPDGRNQSEANITATMAMILRGKLKNHFELILADILPSPMMISEEQKISKNHPAKELNGVSASERFAAGNVYPVKNDNPKNKAPIKTAPPAAKATSLPFDLLSITGNELGVSGLPRKL